MRLAWPGKRREQAVASRRVLHPRRFSERTSDRIMKLKSYFAQTVEAALGLAREELGPEAMLVESRKAPPEAGRAGDYERGVRRQHASSCSRLTPMMKSLGAAPQSGGRASEAHPFPSFS